MLHGQTASQSHRLAENSPSDGLAVFRQARKTSGRPPEDCGSVVCQHDIGPKPASRNLGLVQNLTANFPYLDFRGLWAAHFYGTGVIRQDEKEAFVNIGRRIGSNFTYACFWSTSECSYYNRSDLRGLRRHKVRPTRTLRRPSRTPRCLRGVQNERHTFVDLIAASARLTLGGFEKCDASGLVS